MTSVQAGRPEEVRNSILVVDDDPRSRALVRGFLQTTWEVNEAEDGLQALALLERERVDLVLLDVMMPEIDGYDTCRLIKARMAGEFLPVVMLTAFGEQESRTRGLEAGADDFLVKPIDRYELWLRVRAFLALVTKQRSIRGELDDQRKLQALKDELLALLVHDVRAPLQSVAWHLQMLVREERCEAGATHLESSLRSTRRIRSMLDDFLDIRLLEDGSMPLQQEPVRILDLLESVVETVEGLAREASVTLAVDADAGVVGYLDRALARRAIENLAVNGIRHTPRGAQLDVRARSSPTELAIEVADRGPGVPQALRNAIFDKYRDQKRRSGHGLGLVLVRLVVEAHQGSVVVEENPGGGALFRLCFPPCRGPG